MGHNSYDDTTTSCFPIWFHSLPLATHLSPPLDICWWLWYLLYPVWYTSSVTSHPQMIYKPLISYPQWSTSDLLLPLGMISLQSFFLYFLFICLCNLEIPVDMNGTEDVMFGIGLYEFLYLNMLKGWEILHKKKKHNTSYKKYNHWCSDLEDEVHFFTQLVSAHTSPKMGLLTHRRGLEIVLVNIESI